MPKQPKPPTNKGASPLTAKRAVADFDSLPDSALVSLATAAAVLSLGTSTVRRIALRDARLGLRKLPGCERGTRILVGGLRAFMRGEEA